MAEGATPEVFMDDFADAKRYREAIEWLSQHKGEVEFQSYGTFDNGESYAYSVGIEARSFSSNIRVSGENFLEVIERAKNALKATDRDDG